MASFAYRRRYGFLYLILATCLSTIDAICQSYGIDFQNGQSYFINSQDNSEFTCVTEFSNCTGTANVLLVDPESVVRQCSDIATQPDFANELSTCPLEKSAMTNGTWHILVLNNNGNDPNDPGLAADRMFVLTVAPQQTIYYTPTVTMASVTTPTTTSTSTINLGTTITASTVVVTTVPGGMASQTMTVTPNAITVFVATTHTRTVTRTQYTKSITYATHTATCSTPKRMSRPDPKPSKSVLALASTQLAAAAASRGPQAMQVVSDIEALMDRMPDDSSLRGYGGQLERRAPDVATTTITDTNTANFITTTLLGTAPTSTVVDYTTITASYTTTPTVTTSVGITTTAPTPTTTLTSHTVTVITITTTSTIQMTLTRMTTPGSVIASCTSAGGFFG